MGGGGMTRIATILGIAVLWLGALEIATRAAELWEEGGQEPVAFALELRPEAAGAAPPQMLLIVAGEPSRPLLAIVRVARRVFYPAHAGRRNPARSAAWQL
jgi:hypothetical protein